MFVKLLLHLDLEACHNALLELPRVQLANKALIVCLHALYTKDHKHVDLGCLRDVVVRQMDCLEGFALGQRPLDALHVVSEVHARQINVDKLGRGVNDID